eukprot:CAMPEP_0176456276 /NCGR_PEP_ID=MMETSP0127-20121128/31187_1 /TAXON_ID=938130 /ORGANISM="Platyophrya macrostoma, Strain WH" /LENGTH=111 /DNA_ID=CAMNT_0017846195 /DNA_START=102 /DNA_END=433 /DNA_ORIENTATION=+
MRDGSIDRSKPVFIRLQQCIFMLKAKGVNAFHDITLIEEARTDIRTRGPIVVLQEAILLVRKALAVYAKPGRLKEKGDPEWFVGDALKRITKKGVQRTSIGICRMVVAVDA